MAGCFWNRNRRRHDRAECHINAKRALTMSDDLRVLHVIGSLGIGGAEQWLVALLRHFRDTRHQRTFDVRTDILIATGNAGPLDDIARSLGARLHFMKYSGRNLTAFTRSFRALLRSERYHALHHHQDHSAGTHMLLGSGLLPAVRAVSYHNPLVSRAAASASPVQKLAAGIGACVVRRQATHILGTSSDTLVEYGVDQVSVPAHIESRALHCGFDVGRFRGSRETVRSALLASMGWAPSSKLLLFVGRLYSHAQHNQKNPYFAVEVAAACMRRDPDVRMLLVGGAADPAGHANMENHIRALGLTDRFGILGQRSDIPDLMRAADILLFPSFSEGLGMVAVEAQAAGLPVLASSTVPKEVVVVPEILRFLALQQGAKVWADSVLEMLAAPKPDRDACNDRTAASPYAIQNSADALLGVYLSGNFK